MSYERDIAILDKWTNVNLEAYWRELVKEAQELNRTGKTCEDQDTTTGSTD